MPRQSKQTTTVNALEDEFTGQLDEELQAEEDFHEENPPGFMTRVVIPFLTAIVLFLLVASTETYFIRKHTLVNNEEIKTINMAKLSREELTELGFKITRADPDSASTKYSSTASEGNNVQPPRGSRPIKEISTKPSNSKDTPDQKKPSDLGHSEGPIPTLEGMPELFEGGAPSLLKQKEQSQHVLHGQNLLDPQLMIREGSSQGDQYPPVAVTQQVAGTPLLLDQHLTAPQQESGGQVARFLKGYPQQQVQVNFVPQQQDLYPLQAHAMPPQYHQGSSYPQQQNGVWHQAAQVGPTTMNQQNMNPLSESQQEQGRTLPETRQSGVVQRAGGEAGDAPSKNSLPQTQSYGQQSRFTQQGNQNDIQGPQQASLSRPNHVAQTPGDGSVGQQKDNNAWSDNPLGLRQQNQGASPPQETNLAAGGYPQSGNGAAQNSIPGSSVNHQHSIPSYVSICRALVDARQASVAESHHVCHDGVDTTKSLAQIFLSSYLGGQAVALGYPIAYSHQCDRLRQNRVLIQETLPPILHQSTTNGQMDRETLQGFCRMIINTWEQNGAADPVDILLWDTIASPQTRGRGMRRRRRRLYQTADHNQDTNAAPNRIQALRMMLPESQNPPSPSIAERLVPLLSRGLYHAAMRAREIPGALTAGYGVLKGRNSASERIARNRAVVYLPCLDALGQDVVVLPYYNYIIHLPLSVQVVDIVMSHRCMRAAFKCENYAKDFASTIRQFLPRVSVELIVAKPSSPDAFTRLIEAEYVLCGPGFGMACLLPALSRVGAPGRFILFDVGTDQVPGRSSSSVIAQLSPHLAAHIHPPKFNFAVAQLSAFQNQQELLPSFLQTSPDVSTGTCRFVRGRVGQWVQDMKYAEFAQYRTPLTHYSGNAERYFRKRVETGEYGQMVFRPATTHRWEETRYQQCQTSIMTLAGMCKVLDSLSVRRIFVVGDSLSLQFAQSMWMWLTTEGSSPTERGSLEPNFRQLIRCPNFEFTLQFVRNDEFVENSDPVSIQEKKSNCGTYCYPWTQEYQADKQKTILIANCGAHIHEYERFRSAVDRFVQVFDAMNRPEDIVLWRTLVPGHWDCGRPGLVPFNSFSEYMKDAEAHQNPKEEIYSWGKFASYNDYAIKVIDDRRATQTDQPRAIMEVLDVFPVTVLRPDGHCSDEFRPPNYLATDCLHYTLPGPIDWWTHLAFSHLVDVALSQR